MPELTDIEMLAEELRAIGVQFSWPKDESELNFTMPSGNKYSAYPDNYGDTVSVSRA